MSGTSQLRIIHNVFNGPKVNIFVNKKLFAANLAYKDCTSYLNLCTNKNKIEVKLTDGTLIFPINLDFKRKNTFTLAIVGDINDLKTVGGKIYEDDLSCPDNGYARINFINGMFGAPSVDLYVNNVRLINNVLYGEASDRETKVSNDNRNPYINNLVLKQHNTENVIVPDTPIYLASGGIYTVLTSGTTSQPVLIHYDDNDNSCEELQKDFNPQAFMGKWYQIASIPQFYEANCPRATAEYTLLSDRINVFNTCYNEKWEVVDTITGSASPVGCNPASLRVVFPNQPFETPNFPNYLVHKTDYTNYAIVGSPTRNSFYILSRDSHMSLKEYKMFLVYADELGYDSSKIRNNYHSLSRV